MKPLPPSDGSRKSRKLGHTKKRKTPLSARSWRVNEVQFQHVFDAIVGGRYPDCETLGLELGISIPTVKRIIRHMKEDRDLEIGVSRKEGKQGYFLKGRAARSPLCHGTAVDHSADRKSCGGTDSGQGTPETPGDRLRTRQ